MFSTPLKDDKFTRLKTSVPIRVGTNGINPKRRGA